MTNEPERLIEQLSNAFNKLSARLDRMEEETAKARAETVILAATTAQALCLAAIRSDDPERTVEAGFAGAEQAVDVLRKELYASHAQIEASSEMLSLLRLFSKAGVQGILDARAERRWWQLWR